MRSLSWLGLLSSFFLSALVWAQAPPPVPPPEVSNHEQSRAIEDWNRRLHQLSKANGLVAVAAEEYRIGGEDLLEITVFEAAELSRVVRVAASGEITLPLLGAVRVAGLTPQELERVLEGLLRRRYMREPQVSVFVRELESRAVSVVGAVAKPGVYQIRGQKSLIEVLALAEGLAEDAGDTVRVERGARAPGVASVPAAAAVEPNGRAASPAADTPPAAAESLTVDLKQLLESAEAGLNLPLYPGDIVKVTRAGIVYVVGEVKRPGGFVLKSNENISVLQAIALGEGLTRTAAKSHARIIRTDPQTGARQELALDLGRILAGRAADPLLQPKDIVFIPNSAARSALYRGAEAALSIVSGVIIWRR